MSSIIIVILQKIKLTFEEAEQLSQVFTTGVLQSWNLHLYKGLYNSVT